MRAVRYHFASCPDGTEISYSELLHSGSGGEELRIFIERWDEGIRDFDTLEFFLPSLRISRQRGFSAKETEDHLEHLKRLGAMLFESVRENGRES